MDTQKLLGLRKRLVDFRRENSGPNKPAFMMYTNEVLDAILAANPSTLEELHQIRGVRKDFVKKYGNTVLNMLKG